MKRMGRDIPPHLISRFKKSLKTEQLGKLAKPCYVVDEILPSELVTKTDNKIANQRSTGRPRISIGFTTNKRARLYKTKNTKSTHINTVEGIAETVLASGERKRKKVYAKYSK